MRLRNSSLYKKMEKNIKLLKKQFCTSAVLSNPISQTSQLFIDAYLVLVHAEFESYIETCINNKIDNDLIKFRTSHQLTKSLASCAAFSNKQHNPSQDLTSALSNSFESILNENVNQLHDTIDKNHGIKQYNIVPLLTKIGFDFNSVDHTEFLELDNFGKVRGDIAHKSIGIRAPVTITDEELRIQRLLKVFSDIDKNI